MKIVTLNPPFLENFSREARSPAIAKSGTFYYPMWLAYATGYLESRGHEVKLIDAAASRIPLDEVVKQIKEFNPSLLVCSTSTPSIYADIESAVAIKKQLPSLYTVLVGVHV
jgi:anaerobic magnesium-protoporphyrin IX monomethyl ester cyclase